MKGAYTQSRLRQMIFGGVTSHVLAYADMPQWLTGMGVAILEPTTTGASA